MRFHVCALPHTQTTQDFSTCAYTNKVVGFCKMMKDLGHTVYLYAGEKNEAPCDELIQCISELERAAAVGDKHYVEASFDASLPHWQTFNQNAINGIRQRAHPKDFICVIAGIAHKAIADAFPNMMTVEFGVGYAGVFSKYRVWESYAWMHTCYGSAHPWKAQDADGLWMDAVIPGYLDPAGFPFGPVKDDYYLFVGRMIERKGVQIAADVCKAKNVKLMLAGPGSPPDYGEYVGVVDPVRRGELMSKAKAIFVPSLYLEPFGNVAVEAMACGTPVICSDWGAMTETVIQGVTGFRCRSFAEFCQGVDDVGKLDPAAIRQHAVGHYSLDVVGKKYQAYFHRLESLWGKGWYEAQEAA